MTTNSQDHAYNLNVSQSSASSNTNHIHPPSPNNHNFDLDVSFSITRWGEIRKRNANSSTPAPRGQRPSISEQRPPPSPSPSPSSAFPKPSNATVNSSSAVHPGQDHARSNSNAESFDIASNGSESTDAVMNGTDTDYKQNHNDDQTPDNSRFESPANIDADASNTPDGKVPDVRRTFSSPISAKSLAKDTERELKWIKMTKQWSIYSHSKSDKLKSRVRKGVPDSFRSTVWKLFSNIDQRIQDNEGVYRNLLQTCSEACQYGDVIKRDLNRTFPTHVLFRDSPFASNGKSPENNDQAEGNSIGRSSMYHVLSSYASHDPEVGYCQGMGFIVGILLMYFTEEESFWFLERTMRGDNYNLHGLYSPGFPLLHRYFFIFEKLLQRHCPQFWQTLDKTGITPHCYATQWFITLYSYNLNFDIVLRIWDIFFSEGVKILFRVAICFMKLVEKKVIKSDMEGIITALKEIHLHEEVQDADIFISSVLKVNISRKDIKHYYSLYDAQNRK